MKGNLALAGEVPEKLNFPKEEEAVLAYWNEIGAFERANELSEGRPVYSFYDGPPFATGTPHYGHLLAGTIKDVVTRFAYQTGHHVPRRFGWDCHGLPIEWEIEKDLGIKSKADVLAYGLGNYNEACRSIVMRYRDLWKATVHRIGRWIDFENDYKSMNTSFMESVWWVFKEVYDKGLVYKGFKVMPYSTGLTTPLANFEAKQNYMDVNDPAVVVSFPVIGDELGASFVAWTTTPWTLPSNLALCVHPKLTYVYVTDLESEQTYIMAEKRLVELFKKPKKGKKANYEVKKKVLGSDLVGKRYEPLFNYFYDGYKDRAFKVLGDTYVTDDAGTGVVHQAPAFGEDDYRVCLANNIIDKGEGIPCPLDEDGNFVAPVVDFEGMYVKKADEPIMAQLKAKGRMVKKASITHSYAFCPRSKSPLISRAVPAWFVNVEAIKEQLVANNADGTRWVPDFVQHNRFGDWLKNARDWNVSRNRYWGTPLPIWVHEESGEVHVVGSIAELEKLSGVTGITDIHTHKIDHITIKSPKTGVEMRRIPEVFDCWFESGSMPYAQQHYPYGEGSKQRFEDSFPADFIAEGLDQTRGWFYTLMVLSTALFGKPAFRNCVVNGLVLAEDGKKMSKSLKNYPDPNLVLDSHGADALRLYLINSPVVRAEPLRFKEDGVRGVVRDVMLPWCNALRFLAQNARALAVAENKPVTVQDATTYAEHRNQMDRWIVSALGSLITFFRQEMGAYRLYTIVPRLLDFIKSLTDWYIRLNRPRLKGMGSKEEQRVALGTLAHVLLSLARLMAPFAPFFSDYSYKVLRPMAPKELDMDSVHFLMLPEADTTVVDKSFEKAVEHMQEAIKLGRVAREQRELALKQPLREATIVHRDEAVLADIRSLEGYVRSELNVRSVRYSTEEATYLDLRADADGKVLGKKLGKDFKKVHAGVRALPAASVVHLERDGEIEVEGIVVKLAEVNVSRELRKDLEADKVSVKESPTGLLVALDTTVDAELRMERVVRELANRVQKTRKKAGLEPADKVEVFVDTADAEVLEALEKKGAFLASLLHTPPVHTLRHMSPYLVPLAAEEVDPIDDAQLSITLARACYAVSTAELAKQVGEGMAPTIARYVTARPSLAFSKQRPSIEVDFAVPGGDGVKCKLTLGDNVFHNTADRIAAGKPM